MSDCCDDFIVSRGDFDYCLKCDKIICYALVGKYHDEAMAVCKLYDDKLYFFWQQTTSWKHVMESSQEYIGQFKDIIASVTLEERMCGDLIPYENHVSFSNRWKSKVQNPQYALR